MKDIDEMLRRQRAMPVRQLSSNFTSKTIARLGEGEEERFKRPWWKEYIPMRFIHKPALVGAACVVALIATGTTYAAVNGWNVKTMFGGQQDLGNGVRVVRVDAANCPHVGAFNITDKNRVKSGSYYFKISHDSTLTNEQVVDMLDTTCQADAEGAANSQAAQAIGAVLEKPENKNKVVGNYANEIVTAITKDSITVQFPTRGIGDTHMSTLTYKNFDPAMLVTNGPLLGSYDVLKVGDHVTVVYRASGDALLHSETTAPGDVNTDQTVVVAIEKLSPSMQAYYEYQEHKGRDIVQVAPCDSNPTGYCTDAEYLNRQ